MPLDKYELLAETARRRGFFWPSYEIYGGVGGFLDFGPLGTAMKNKIVNKWRRFFIKTHGFIEISTPVITPHSVFKASGHVEHFKDPMIECTKCHRRFRADHVLKDVTGAETELLTAEELSSKIRASQAICPECNGPLGDVRYFQTMFTTTIGPYSDAVGYGRPEAAQGIFVNFKRIFEVAREKLPLAVAQVGTALRNEISPRQGPIRLREFTIMEFELFFDPEEPTCPYLEKVAHEKVRILPGSIRLKGGQGPVESSVKEAVQKKLVINEWLAYFMGLSKLFLAELGVPHEKQRFNEKLPGERAHYSAQTFDHEILTERWGWVETAGIAYRTDFDLTAHMKHSGVDLRVFKPHDKPVTKRTRIVSPIKSRIGPAFKENAGKVLEILSAVNADEIERSFKEKGHYEAQGFRILADQVELQETEHTETGRRFIPHVVEPSYGAERLTYVSLEYAYSKNDDRVILRIPKDIAPIQAVVLPLVGRNGLPERAGAIYRLLLDEGFDVEYDEAGSIGRRYARADEVGVPLAVTVDYQTLKDDTVTLRDRDSWEQVRAEARKLSSLLSAYFSGKMGFHELGKPFAGHPEDAIK